MLDQPSLYGRMLVRGVVVRDQMKRLVLGRFAIDLAQELQPLEFHQEQNTTLVARQVIGQSRMKVSSIAAGLHRPFPEFTSGYCHLRLIVNVRSGRSARELPRLSPPYFFSRTSTEACTRREGLGRSQGTLI
jgi:hypothetical protein